MTISSSSREKLNWLILESTLIVASILLAFWIDAWWENRQKRIEEGHILEALRAEFQENANLLPFFIRNHGFNLDSAEALITELRNVEDGSRASVRDADALVITVNGTFDPISGSYDSMIQSGTLRYVENSTVREKLANWPALVEDAIENQNQLRTIWGPRLNTILFRQVDMASLHELRGCREPTTRRLCSRNLLELESSYELIGHLVRVRAWHEEAIRELRIAESAALELVELLDEELAAR
jgi:hypothetical protein